MENINNSNKYLYLFKDSIHYKIENNINIKKIYSDDYKKIENIIKELEKQQIIRKKWFIFPTEKGIYRRLLLISNIRLEELDYWDNLKDYIIKSDNLEHIIGKRKFRIRKAKNKDIKTEDYDYPKVAIKFGTYTYLKEFVKNYKTKITIIIYGHIQVREVKKLVDKINEKFKYIKLVDINERAFDIQSSVIYYEILPANSPENIKEYIDKFLKSYKNENKLNELILIITEQKITKELFSLIKTQSIKEGRGIIPSKISRIQFLTKDDLEKILNDNENIFINLVSQMLYKLDIIPFIPIVGRSYPGRHIICAIGFTKRPKENEIAKMSAVAMPILSDYIHAYILLESNYIKSSKSYELLNSEEWDTIFKAIINYTKKFIGGTKSGLIDYLIFLRHRPFIYNEYIKMKNSNYFSKLFDYFSQLYFISITRAKIKSRDWHLPIGKNFENEIIIDNGLAILRYKFIKSPIILTIREITKNEYKIPTIDTTKELVKIYEWSRLFRPDDITDLPDKIWRPYILKLAKKYAEYYKNVSKF